MCEKTKDVFFAFQILPEFKFIYISPSIEEILGYDQEIHYTNDNFAFEIIHPDDFYIQKSKVDKNSDFSKAFCARFKHKDGHYVWIEDFLVPTYNENGDLISVSGFSRDITERKKLEKMLEEQNKLLEMDVTAEIKTNKIMEKTLKSQEELLDNGIVIEKKKFDIIFDRFEQADKSLSRNAEGTGIGLNLVKSIDLLHGGSINVESEYGKGSKFTVTLPAGAVAKENMLYDRNIKNKDERIRLEFSDVYF